MPTNESLVRLVCSVCGSIHYQNPILVVGTLPIWEQKILLCKRAIAPQRGYWTLPAGFMEQGETLAEAAKRETMEEAGASVKLERILSILSVPTSDQMHIFFLAQLLDKDFTSGQESLAVALFSAAHIPWEQIAFPTVYHTLKHYQHYLAKETNLPCVADVIKQPDGSFVLDPQTIL